MSSKKPKSDSPENTLRTIAKMAITETRGCEGSNDATSVPLKLTDWLDMKIGDYKMFEQWGTEEQFQFHMSFEGIDTVTKISEALANLKAVLERVEAGGNLTMRDVPILEKADKAFNFVIYAATKTSKNTPENRDMIDELISCSIDDSVEDYDKALKQAINRELALRRETVTQLQEIQTGIKNSAAALKQQQSKGQEKQ